MITRNDGSYSPNNAFEAGFSSGNVFANNVANYSNYGFWLGYSTDSAVRGNEIRANRFDGIAIENGNGNVIEQNHIEANRNGIRLWVDRSLDESETMGPFFRNYSVAGNRIAASRDCGVWVTDDHAVDLKGNRFEHNLRDYVPQPAGSRYP